MSIQVFQLAEQIKKQGRGTTSALPPLIEEARRLANDESQDLLTRALAYRAEGNALQLLNQFGSALQSYRSSVGLLEQSGDSLELARTLHAMVGPLLHLGLFDELFACEVRARSLFIETGDRRGLARLEVNLASAYFRLDRFPQSLACAERALPILSEIGDHEGYLAASINAALALGNLHEFERARERYRDAHRVADELGNRSWMLISRSNLAYLRYLSGEAVEALNELKEVREEYIRDSDDRHACLCWLDEAEILLQIGDLEEAIHAAKEARVLGAQHDLNSEIGRSLLFEAAALLRCGMEPEALPLLAEATRRFERGSNGMWNAISKLETALLNEEGNAGSLREAIAARRALENTGLPHRIAMADVVVGRIQRSVGNPEQAIASFQSARALASESRSQWMQFHACYELGVSTGSNEFFLEAEGMLDSLWKHLGPDELKLAFLADRENVYTHLVRSALSESPEKAFAFSEKARSRVLREKLVDRDVEHSSAAIQARLAKDESIVEYFIAGDDLYIFTIDSDGLKSVRRSQAVERLRSTCELLDRHLDSCGVKWERMTSVRHHLQATAKAHLHALYKELVEPVREHLRKVTIFVPHGFLHHVPFQALFDGEKALGESHQVGYSPSAALYCSPGTSTQGTTPLFVAFSPAENDPIIDEVRKAAGHFPNATVLINPSFAELREATAEARSLLHIAGHACIDTVGGKLAWIETPQGRLTSRDMMDLRIQAKTLVITGCRTARRIIRPGDEWIGLMRTFYLSGATTIVSALWEIRDESAQRFVDAFYERFDGENAPSAARDAAHCLKEWNDHPYFWAGFGTFVRRPRTGLNI